MKVPAELANMEDYKPKRGIVMVRGAAGGRCFAVYFQNYPKGHSGLLSDIFDQLQALSKCSGRPEWRDHERLLPSRDDVVLELMNLAESRLEGARFETFAPLDLPGFERPRPEMPMAPSGRMGLKALAAGVCRGKLSRLWPLCDAGRAGTRGEAARFFILAGVSIWWLMVLKLVVASIFAIGAIL